MMIENQYVKYDIAAASKHFKGKIIDAVILGKELVDELTDSATEKETCQFS